MVSCTRPFLYIFVPLESPSQAFVPHNTDLCPSWVVQAKLLSPPLSFRLLVEKYFCVLADLDHEFLSAVALLPGISSCKSLVSYLSL